MRRLPAVAAAGLAAVTFAAGCGGDAPARKTGGSPTPAAGEPAYGKDTLSAAQIERFARLRIPAEATSLHSDYRPFGPDRNLRVSFVLPPSAVADFERRAKLSQPLQDGRQMALAKTGDDLGWDLGKAQRVQAVNEVLPGLGRIVAIVRDEPDRARVYVSASTL